MRNRHTPAGTGRHSASDASFARLINGIYWPSPTAWAGGPPLGSFAATSVAFARHGQRTPHALHQLRPSFVSRLCSCSPLLLWLAVEDDCDTDELVENRRKMGTLCLFLDRHPLTSSSGVLQTGQSDGSKMPCSARSDSDQMRQHLRHAQRTSVLRGGRIDSPLILFMRARFRSSRSIAWVRRSIRRSAVTRRGESPRPRAPRRSFSGARG